MAFRVVNLVGQSTSIVNATNTIIANENSISGSPLFSIGQITGTSGQILVTPNSFNPRSINLALPQNITPSSNVTFAGVTLTNGATNGYVLTSNASGLGVWSAPSASGITGVNSITGTANQIIASDAQGNVVLSTPQDLGLSSNVQFNSLLLDQLSLNQPTLSGYVLTSDISGFATFQPSPTAPVLSVSGSVGMINAVNTGGNIALTLPQRLDASANLSVGSVTCVSGVITAALALKQSTLSGYVLTSDISGFATFQPSPTAPVLSVSGSVGMINAVNTGGNIALTLPQRLDASANLSVGSATCVSGVITSALALTQSTLSGYVLTSDISGFATFQPSPTAPVLSVSGNTGMINAVNSGGNITLTLPQRLDASANLSVGSVTCVSGVITSALALTQSTLSGYVLTSDISGFATFQPSPTAPVLSVSGSVGMINAVNTGGNIALTLPQRLDASANLSVGSVTCVSGVITSALALTQSTLSGYVLTSDISGFATFQPSPTAPVLSVSGNTGMINAVNSGGNITLTLPQRLDASANLSVDSVTCANSVVSNTLQLTQGSVSGYTLNCNSSGAAAWSSPVAVNGNTNIIVAQNALSASLSGTYNSVVGNGALLLAGNENVSIGYKAAGYPFPNPDPDPNALPLNQTVTIGYNAGRGMFSISGTVIGDGNCIVGYNSLLQSSAQSTCLFGSQTLSNFVNTSFGNCAFGTQAMQGSPFADNANNNSAFGYQSMYSILAGDCNVGIGNFALSSLTYGNFNTAVGFTAGNNISPSGENNTLIGVGAGSNGVTNNSTAVGAYALQNNGTGQRMNAFGYQALQNTTFEDCCAFGFQALQDSNSSNNCAFGNYTMTIASVTGGKSSAFGDSALYNLTSGTNNTAVGANCLDSVTTGSNNTAVGVQAGDNLQGGSNNTFIGYQAGFNCGPSVNVTALGNGATPSTSTVNNEITLGNNSIGALRCNVTNITGLSDARDKANISGWIPGVATNIIEAVRPVTFNWNRRDWYADASGIVPETNDGSLTASGLSIGFIAQELKTVQDTNNWQHLNLVYESNANKLEVTPGNLIPVITQASKETISRVSVLEALVATLQSELANALARINTLEQLL